jgi:hypothetical protein
MGRENGQKHIVNFAHVREKHKIPRIKKILMRHMSQESIIDQVTILDKCQWEKRLWGLACGAWGDTVSRVNSMKYRR